MVVPYPSPSTRPEPIRTDNRTLFRRPVVVLTVTAMIVGLVASFVATSVRTPGLLLPGVTPPPDPVVELGEIKPDLRERFVELIDGHLDAHEGLQASVALTDGRHELSAGSDIAFETASIVKVEILLRWLLARQDDGLPAEEYRLAEQMMTVSDNDATNRLCLSIVGLTAPDDIPGGVDACTVHGYWGHDPTTAEQQLPVLHAAFHSERLTTESRDVVKKFMAAIVPEQAWGVSAAANDSQQVWLKNGWDDRDGWLVHSMGVVDGPTPIHIVVLTFGHDDFRSGVDHVEELTRLAVSVIVDR